MRFEVLHGNINEVYRDLPVENGEAPFRIRRYMGDVFGRIGYCADITPPSSLCGYAAVIMGKTYLYRMFACAQSRTKTPSGYFHALATEAAPEDFAGDLSPLWNLQFASEEDLYAAAQGEIFELKTSEASPEIEINIAPQVMREIFYACLNRWSVNRSPIVILVPQEESFHDYVKAFLGQVYSYFPAALRAASGFVSAPREGYEPERGISLVFLPDIPKNAAKPNAVRAQECFGYFSSLFAPELEPFVEYLLALPPAERETWLLELFRQSEGGGDANLFREVKAQDYVAYYDATVAWPNMPGKQLVDLFAEQLKQPLPPAMNRQMEKILTDRFADGEINLWAIQETRDMESVEEVVELAEKLNRIGIHFPALDWKKEILLEASALMLLNQCEGNVYHQYNRFIQHRERLSECFGSVMVQEMAQEIGERKDRLIEEQYQTLAENLENDPESIQIGDCYPENKIWYRRRLAEITNMQFHRSIRKYTDGSVDELFASLKEKLDQCQEMEGEPAVQDMQACYDAYYGLWKAAQSEEARNLTDYFRLLTQIVQIPSPRLRPAMLSPLRKWLNEVWLADYLEAYVDFCQNRPDFVYELREPLEEAIQEDFLILSRHPLHMTISSQTGTRALFDQCSNYLNQLEICGLEKLRAEILLQFNSTRLIENYLVSVQELMAITRFILMNATAALPVMPREKLKELLLAFAAIGAFKPVHFEALLKVSESRDYHRKLWRYCMEQSADSLNEQVRICEIYEKCLGSIEARKQLEYWNRMGAMTPELYRRLTELYQDGEETVLRRKTMETEEEEAYRQALQNREGPFDFDLRRSEESERWSNPENTFSFMIGIDKLYRDIQEEQERAHRAGQQEYLEMLERKKQLEEAQAREEERRRQKKRKRRNRNVLVILAVLLAVTIVGVQLYKYFAGGKIV